MSKKCKLVRDASIWQEMAGQEPVVKKINSYLTCHFIKRKDIPADECLREAIECTRLYKNKSNIAEYLNEQFCGGNKLIVNRLKYCYEPAEKIIQIIEQFSNKEKT